MECEYGYGITVTWQNWSTWKETCSSASVTTINPTWTGPLGVKLGLEGENVLCTIIPRMNTECFLHPLQIPNGYPSLFSQTPPRLTCSCGVPQVRCSYLSFPNGSTFSLTNISIYKSLFCTKIGHLHSVN